MTEERGEVQCGRAGACAGPHAGPGAGLCGQGAAVHHSKQLVHLDMRECYDFDNMIKMK